MPHTTATPTTDRCECGERLLLMELDCHDLGLVGIAQHLQCPACDACYDADDPKTRLKGEPDHV